MAAAILDIIIFERYRLLFDMNFYQDILYKAVLHIPQYQ